uniref:SH2 domain-containing protein n=1 Tax=Angiostrongylus cantonensis TaxID=6313 RepID=A0A0K0DQT3_ANGCA
MFPNPNIRSGRHVECDEAHGYYGEHADLSSTTEFVENPVLPQYVITSDNEWVHPLSEVGNEDEYQLHDLVNMRQQLDYTEEVFPPSNAQTYVETESNLYEIQQVVANEIAIDDMLWNAVEPQQYVSAVHQDSSQQYLQLGVSQTRAPRKIDAALDIYGVHHIAHNSSSESEIETNHSMEYDSRPVIMFEGPVHQSENALPPHHVQILRSKSKSQPCHLSHGESANRTIEPAIDLATDRCVASLDKFCDPNFATTEHQRYVQRPTLHSHYEMADSTRKGGSLYNWTGDGRQHGARVLGTDRAPRFATTSSQATSSTSQSSPFSSGLIRPPLLTNVSGTEVMRRPHLLKGNAVNTTASAIGGYDHAYHRSRSSEHRGTSTSNYHQAMKIERQVARTIDAKSISGLNEGGCTSERFLDKKQEKRFSTSISKGISQCSDKNNYPKNVQVTPGSNATSTSKPKKQYTTMRDEYGRLRRIRLLPDGTLCTRDSSQGNRISQMGRITTETCAGAKGHTPRFPTAETLWNEQSVVGKYGKMGGKRSGQWTGSQAFLTSSNPSSSTSECGGAYQNQNSRSFDAKTQPKTKGKRNDLLHPVGDNNAAKRQKHSRRRVLLDRDRAVATGKGVQVTVLRLWHHFLTPVSFFSTSERAPELLYRLTAVNCTLVPEQKLVS